MRNLSILLAAVLLLVVSALSAGALAADGTDLSWWLIAGGPRVSAGVVSLSGGVGQGVAGVVATGDANMCSGFWCVPAMGPEPPIHCGYLPLLLR
jgi:hypothetical protein